MYSNIYRLSCSSYSQHIVFTGKERDLVRHPMKSGIYNRTVTVIGMSS